ncbi:MAG: hypothetical protein EPO28_13015, partial [Saprospiraceae bacterium]
MKPIVIVLFLLLPFALQSQNNLEMGVFLGFANYQGDLVQDPIDLTKTSLSVGIFTRYHLSPLFKIKGSLYYGFISGDDANSTTRQARGWSFESKLTELGLQVEYHPFGKNRYASGGIFKANISPYLATGIGIINANSTVMVKEATDKDKFPEAGKKATALSVPFIVGLRLDAYEALSIGLEW